MSAAAGAQPPFVPAIVGPLLFLFLLFAGPGSASGAESKGDSCAQLKQMGAQNKIPNKYLLSPGIRLELQKGLQSVFLDNAAYQLELDTTTLLSDGKIGPETRTWLKLLCEDFPVYGTPAEVPDAVARSALHYAEIAAKQPGWRQTVASAQFDAWVRQVPGDWQVNTRQIRRSGAAMVVVRLLEDYAASGGEKAGKDGAGSNDASCKRLLATGKGNQIPQRYLSSATTRRSIQKGLQTVYAGDAEFQSDLARNAALSDGKIGRTTRKWLDRFCRDFPVSGFPQTVPDKVVKSALHYAEIAAARPDWVSVVTDPGFNDWVRGPVPQGQVGNRKLRLSGSAPIVIELIGEYHGTVVPLPERTDDGCPPVTVEGAAIYYELTETDVARLKDRSGFLKQVEKLVGKRFGTEKELDEAIGPTADLLKVDCVRARFLQAIRENKRTPSLGFHLTDTSFRKLRASIKLPTGIEGLADTLFLEDILTELDGLKSEVFENTQELAQFVRAMIQGALDGKDAGASDSQNAPQTPPASLTSKALIEDIVKQVVATAEKVTLYEITAGAVGALNADPLFVAFPDNVLAKLTPLIGVSYVNSQIFRSAASKVLTATPAPGATTRLPGAPTDGGVVKFEPAVVIQARKEGRAQRPLSLAADDCGCAREWDNVGTEHFVVYGFFPFWMSARDAAKVATETASASADSATGKADDKPGTKGGGVPVDFGILNRIGYFALELDEKGSIQDPANPSLWSKEGGALRFLKKARKYHAKVDLVIKARNWQSWNKGTIGKAVNSIWSLLDGKNVDAGMRPDGVALYFPGLPGYPAGKDNIVNLVQALSERLDKHEEELALDLHIVLDGGGSDLTLQILPSGQRSFMGGLEEILVNQENPQDPAMVDLVLVFLEEPVSDMKKRLRLAVENEFRGSVRVEVLRKVLPVIPPNGHGLKTAQSTSCGGATDHYWQLQDDLVYFRDNFRGAAFWPLPQGRGKDQAALKQRLDCTFAKLQNEGWLAALVNALPLDICKLVCPNERLFRDVFLGLAALLILFVLLAGWSCRIRSAIRKRYLYPLLAVALLLALGAALITCIPKYQENEALILGLVVAFLIATWLVYYIRKVKQGPLP